MTTHAKTSATKPAQQVVRLSGPQGIVAAIPQCLGFMPEKSLVLMCLKSPRGRVGPVARIDLPPPGNTEGLVTMLECVEPRVDSVAVVCYHDGDRPVCIDELADALRARRIPITATLSVSRSRIRDARSASAFRRDPGIPLLDPDDRQSVALESAAVLAGRALLPSRAALAASIRPPTGPAPSDTADAIRTVQGELSGQFQEAGPQLTPHLVTIVDEALRHAEAEYGRFGGVALPAAARLIALSTHRPCRDLLMSRTVARNDVVTVGLLSALSRLCPDEMCADLCAVLACAAYRLGDGALAHCALDRALSANRNHRMSQLLRATIDAALPPANLDVLTNIPIPGATGLNPDTVSAFRSPP